MQKRNRKTNKGMYIYQNSYVFSLIKVEVLIDDVDAPVWKFLISDFVKLNEWITVFFFSFFDIKIIISASQCWKSFG